VRAAPALGWTTRELSQAQHIETRDVMDQRTYPAVPRPSRPAVKVATCFHGVVMASFASHMNPMLAHDHHHHHPQGSADRV
jgi:hypothetical protein